MFLSESAKSGGEAGVEINGNRDRCNFSWLAPATVEDSIRRFLIGRFFALMTSMR